MRSQKDPYFSDLCDRVARGYITLSDEKYLTSRIQTTASENKNESFKEGRLSIIVTINDKKDLINQQKLNELLPNEREYRCDSIDRVTNLPEGIKLPDMIKDNSGRTGNLHSELILKVGAPIVITCNHPKQIYKDDGIMNGARGYVQAIQVSKNNQEKVEVVWVVFKNSSIGKRYRFDHNHLRKIFNPGDVMSTPILPTRKNFKRKFGNVEYQRQEFPLSLAYALTAHKCQGDTLDEVIIDFGPDKEHKLKSYILAGSFYVALTRVREGCNVYLRSFEQSYIKVNKKIEEKVETMIKYRSYNFKKIYLDNKVFDNDEAELKVGYLNINGLFDGNHCQYFNADKNLGNLDIMVLAETKLNKEHIDNKINSALSNWSLRGRYDANDQRKHMGLILLISAKSKFNTQISSLTIQTLKRGEHLQIQGLIVRMINGLNIGFIYCGSTPTVQEINAINKSFGECHAILGDFNLSHRIKADKQKLKTIGNGSKVSILNEITRSQSNNQLDYVLVDTIMEPTCFSTSFNNFISDHKSVTLRIGLNGSKISDEIKSRLTFDSESHLKSKLTPISDNESSSSESEVSDRQSICSVNSSVSQQSDADDQINMPFNRKFINSDLATCWLNSCLQLILISIDHSQENFDLSSELGNELIKLWINNEGKTLDPVTVKNIIVAAEDTRVASRLSILTQEIKDPVELNKQKRAVESLRLNLLHGQQCVRDFFVCLQENVISWPDVCTPFTFSLTHSTQCCSCQYIHTIQSTESYLDIDVPANNSCLSTYVSEYLNTSELVAKNCEDGCKKFVQAEKRSKITHISQTEFITVILRRGVEIVGGYRMIDNEVSPTENLYIRYFHF